MKLACILESIDNNIATLYDFNNRKEYKVKLDEQESIIYNDSSCYRWFYIFSK